MIDAMIQLESPGGLGTAAEAGPRRSVKWALPGSRPVVSGWSPHRYEGSAAGALRDAATTAGQIARTGASRWVFS